MTSSNVVPRTAKSSFRKKKKTTKKKKKKKKNRPSTLSLMQEKGGNPNIKNRLGRSALSVAFKNLLINGGQTDYDKLPVALRNANVSAVEQQLRRLSTPDALIKYKRNIGTNKIDTHTTFLYSCVKSNNIDAVRHLISVDADPALRQGYSGSNCLQAAAFYNCEQLVEYFCSLKIAKLLASNVNSANCIALHDALRPKNEKVSFKIVRHLLSVYVPIFTEPLSNGALSRRSRFQKHKKTLFKSAGSDDVTSALKELFSEVSNSELQSQQVVETSAETEPVLESPVEVPPSEDVVKAASIPIEDSRPAAEVVVAATDSLSANATSEDDVNAVGLPVEDSSQSAAEVVVATDSLPTDVTTSEDDVNAVGLPVEDSSQSAAEVVVATDSLPTDVTTSEDDVNAVGLPVEDVEDDTPVVIQPPDESNEHIENQYYDPELVVVSQPDYDKKLNDTKSISDNVSEPDEWVPVEIPPTFVEEVNVNQSEEDKAAYSQQEKDDDSGEEINLSQTEEVEEIEVDIEDEEDEDDCRRARQCVNTLVSNFYEIPNKK